MTTEATRGMVGEGGRVPSAPGSRASHGTSLSGEFPPDGFDPSRRLEFRPDIDGEFDEIVARFADGMVHVETMTDKSCYVGFYWDDGRYCQWWISSSKKLSYSHGDGQSDPPRFNAWGVEQVAPKGPAA